MKRLILKLFVKWYLKDVRNIVKTDLEDEMDMYRFRTPDKTEILIKSLLTYQTIRHFEASSEEERQWAKGAGMILKIMLDAHKMAEIISSEQMDTKGDWLDYSSALRRWKDYAKKFRIK